MNKADMIAKEAGFVKKGETSSNTCSQDKQLFSQVEFVTSPHMPEDWVGVKVKGGISMHGPNGAHYFIPELTANIKPDGEIDVCYPPYMVKPKPYDI